MTTNSSDGVSKLDYSSDKHHKSRGLAQLVDSEVKDQSSEPNSGFLGSLRHRILVESSKFISKMTRNIGSFIVKTIFKSKVPEVSLGDNNESLRNPSDSHFSGGNANSNGDRSFPNTLNSQHITVESSNLSEDKMSKSSSEFQDTSISHSSPLIIKQPNQPFGKIHHQIPLHHANTIDLPSLNALRKSKKRLRMAEIFNNTKESAARTNTGFSMPPSVLLSGAPPLYDFDAQANNSNLKRNSRLEYESKTANRGPLPPGYGQSLLKYASINDSKPPGGFQHIPLERFTTIEPEFGAFRTSIEYRLERKSLEQDGMTIHSLDEDSAEFLSKLGLSSKLDADESANIVELCLRKLSKKAKMAHGVFFKSRKRKITPDPEEEDSSDSEFEVETSVRTAPPKLVSLAEALDISESHVNSDKNRMDSASLSSNGRNRRNQLQDLFLTPFFPENEHYNKEQEPTDVPQ